MSQSPDEPPVDLKTLAAEAHHAATATAASAAATGRQKEQKRKKTALLWVCVLWLVAAASWGWQMRLHLVEGLHDESDLAVLMEQAREDVDNATRAQGRLPENLSSPILASVVNYSVIDAKATPPTYRLEGSLGDARQTWTNAK